MNKIVSILGLTIVFYLFGACGECEDCTGNGNYKIKATIIYVNETSSNIKAIECDRVIAPGATFKLEIEDVLGVKPNVDNFPVSIFPDCRMAYTDGTNLKCEDGIRNIENYIDRKEISPLVFEFTFKFTEQRKSLARLCN